MEERKLTPKMIEMDKLRFSLHSPAFTSTPYQEINRRPKRVALSESFIDASVVVGSPEEDVSYLDPSTRLFKRFISNDSGLEHIGCDYHSEHLTETTLGRGDGDSDFFGDNLSTDSALGQSVLSAEELFLDDEDHDTSFLGTQQVKFLLSARKKQTARAKTKSLSEELAQASDCKRSEQTCPNHPEDISQLYCEVCEEMCCIHCTKDTHQGHTLSTVYNARMKRKAKLQTLTKNAREQQSCSAQEVKKFSEYRDQLKQQGEYIQGEINARSEFFHKLIDRWCDKTSFQLQTILADEQIYIENKLKTLELHMDMVEKLCSDGEQLIRDQTASDELKDRQESINSLEDINQNKLPRVERKVNLILGSGSSITPDMFGHLAWSTLDTDAEPVHSIAAGPFIRQFDTRRGLRNRHRRYTASGLSLTKDDMIIVTDIGTDMVQVFDQLGNQKLLLNTYPLQQPTKTVMLHDGTYAVVCKNSVKIFDSCGEFKSDLKSNLFCPYDATVNRNGDLIVTDMGERQACIYMYARADHRELNYIVGGIRAPAFQNAWNVCTDKNDSIIVSDYQEHCVKIFTPDGLLICEFGQKGCGVGQFFHPAGACVDKFGNILVADSANNRVQMFSPQGDFMTVFISEDLKGPVDLAMTKKGQLVVLQGDGKINVYRYIN